MQVKIGLPEAEEEAKFVIGQISKLKYELQTNKSLAPLGAQNALDYDHWKLDLEQALQRSSDKDLKWFDSPWLLVECYMYKKLNDFMMQTKYFRNLTHSEPRKGEL
ncbi:Damage-control phosphatase ARMT1 [Halotydeus destructor]|nr:Damage-control phosphatase ARMT1 [Halotydeus destructor]